MDAATLVKAMPGLSLERAKQLTAGCNQAMIKGGITTRLRAAMFLAQIGHESISLRHKRELGSGQRYAPYIGRTFIQITWESNYRSFGTWAGVGEKFVRDPVALEDDKWAWLGPVWYWTTHDLNGFADRGDVRGATRRINGGFNGLADRQARYQRCMSLGDAILPNTEGELSMADAASLQKQLNTLAAAVAKVTDDVGKVFHLLEHGDKPGNAGETHPYNLETIVTGQRKMQTDVNDIKRKLGLS